MSTNSPFPGDAATADSPGRQTVGQIMRPPTTIEPDAHLAAAAYLIEHSHDPALVAVTDETREPVAMISDADITRAVVHGRSLEISEANARQLGRRARAHLAEPRREPVHRAACDRLLTAFLDAAQVGAVARLARLLADDVLSHSDRRRQVA
jgi:hypothetical protein